MNTTIVITHHDGTVEKYGGVTNIEVRDNRVLIVCVAGKLALIRNADAWLFVDVGEMADEM